MCGYKQQGIVSLAFGLGLILSFMFPEPIIIIITSIVVIVLSICLLKNWFHYKEVLAMKVVLVKSPLILGFFLRKIFKIKKEKNR